MRTDASPNLRTKKIRAKTRKDIRKRIIYESQELVSRNNVFLVINGLVAAVGGLSGTAQKQIALPLVCLMIVIDILWLVCAYQSWWLLKALAKWRNELLVDARCTDRMSGEDYVEECRRTAQEQNRIVKWLRKHLLTTSETLGLWIPMIVLSAWISAIAGLMWGYTGGVIVGHVCVLAILVVWLIRFEKGLLEHDRT